MINIDEMKNKLIIADGCAYNMDCYQTKLNNNVLVVGTSGSGKTRSIVTPNLLQATGSYIVSDPKGNLYDKYGDYLREKGYRVVKLDLVNPDKSAHYNFMCYIHNEQDIVKVVDSMISLNGKVDLYDDFWDKAARLLLQSIFAYMWEFRSDEEQTIGNALRLLDACKIDEHSPDTKTKLDFLMEAIPGDSYAARQYKRFRIAAGKTLKSILIAVYAELAAYDSREFRKMTAFDELDIASFGERKTAVFVIVSDTDRCMDAFANIFFTQALNVLCMHADNECEDNRLPVDVRFILDDFATNCVIKEFPRMIASIRSRGISAMLMIQAESQLTATYGENGRTIIGNCDTYVYLGGNDYYTADQVARRLNVPVANVLYMPVGECVVFRRGQHPHTGRTFPLEDYIAALEENEHEEKELEEYEERGDVYYEETRCAI